MLITEMQLIELGKQKPNTTLCMPSCKFVLQLRIQSILRYFVRCHDRVDMCISIQSTKIEVQCSICI